MIIDKLFIDLFELSYKYIDILEDYLETTTEYKIKKLSPTEYEVGDLFKITIFKRPSTTLFTNLIYVKVLNHNLYDELSFKITLKKIEKFFSEIKYRGRTYRVEYNGIKKLDLGVDIQEDLFTKIDLNNLKQYKTKLSNVKPTTLNNTLQKTLYLNTQAVKHKAQKLCVIVYQKDKEIIHHSQKNYINKNNVILTRVELKFRDTTDGKEKELLKAISSYFIKDIDFLITHKDLLVKYIMHEYRDYIYLERDGEMILDYDLLFNEPTQKELNILKDFIKLYKDGVGSFRGRASQKKKTQRENKLKTMTKQNYTQELTKIELSYTELFMHSQTLNNFIEMIDKGGVIQTLIEKTPMDYHELEQIKIVEKSHNGRFIKTELHKYILNKLFIQEQIVSSSLSNDYEIKVTPTEWFDEF